MFTGIVQGTVEVVSITESTDLKTLTLRFPSELCQALKLGASVAVDGVCLTVANIHEEEITFDVMVETLRRTTLGGLVRGDSVNIERSAKIGDELGGHQVSGHIDGVAEIIDAQRPENNCILTLQISPEWMRYIFNKGYIALNGASLTVNDVQKKAGTFTVYLIPETLRLTTFLKKEKGDRLNFEIERTTQITVDTIEAMLKEKGESA